MQVDLTTEIRLLRENGYQVYTTREASVAAMDADLHTLAACLIQLARERRALPPARRWQLSARARHAALWVKAERPTKRRTKQER